MSYVMIWSLKRGVIDPPEALDEVTQKFMAYQDSIREAEMAIAEDCKVVWRDRCKTNRELVIALRRGRR